MYLIQALLVWFLQTTSLLICNLSLRRPPSFSLRLCLPRQISYCPMCAIPNLNIMVEHSLGVISKVGATNRRERRLQGKMYVHNQYINNTALFLLQSWLAYVDFDLGDYVLQSYVVSSNIGLEFLISQDCNQMSYCF
jgi:hypothetical protein